MRPSERVDHLVEIRDRLNYVDTRHVTAMAKLREFASGFPGGGSNGGGKGGHSDRTGTLALKADPFVRLERNFDAALELARDALREAHRIMLIATKHEVQDDPMPACRSCVRVKDFRGVPLYAPVHGQGLCQFCLRWLRAEGVWPPVGIVEKHHRGQRISERDVALHTKAGA